MGRSDGSGLLTKAQGIGARVAASLPPLDPPRVPDPHLGDLRRARRSLDSDDDGSHHRAHAERRPPARRDAAAGRAPCRDARMDRVRRSRARSGHHQGPGAGPDARDESPDRGLRDRAGRGAAASGGPGGGCRHRRPPPSRPGVRHGSQSARGHRRARVVPLGRHLGGPEPGRPRSERRRQLHGRDDLVGSGQRPDVRRGADRAARPREQLPAHRTRARPIRADAARRPARSGGGPDPQPPHPHGRAGRAHADRDRGYRSN